MKKTKLPKKYWEKGKSKFLELRPELQSTFNIKVDPEFRKKDIENIVANQTRRKQLKVNQNNHPDSYYNDCYVNSKEYKK